MYVNTPTNKIISVDVSFDEPAFLAGMHILHPYIRVVKIKVPASSSDLLLSRKTVIISRGSSRLTESTLKLFYNFPGASVG